MMRIVFLIDGNSYSVGSIGNLSNGIYNKAVILLAVIGGYNIKTVADIEERGKIILIGSRILLSKIILAELGSQRIELSGTFLIESGKILTVVSVKQRFLLFSNIPFITFAARGAQEPFSIKPTVRLEKLRSVR